MRRGAAVLGLLVVIAVGVSGMASAQTGMMDPSPPADRVSAPAEEVSSRPPIDNPDQDGFPVVSVALAVVALGAVVVAIRRPWNRS